MEQTGRLGCPVGRKTLILCPIHVSTTILVAAFTVCSASTLVLASSLAKLLSYALQILLNRGCFFLIGLNKQFSPYVMYIYDKIIFISSDI